MAITFGVLTKRQATREALRDINRLTRQLAVNDTREARRGALTDLRAIVGDSNAVLSVARDGARIVGVGVLYIAQKIGTRKGYIEDVVVDREHRGGGIGTAIMKVLITAGRAKKVRSITLTSRPERVAANRLYRKIGFLCRNTNVYSMKL